MIEFDKFFVWLATEKQVKENMKRGKESQGQANVTVAAESDPLHHMITYKHLKNYLFEFV